MSRFFVQKSHRWLFDQTTLEKSRVQRVFVAFLLVQLKNVQWQTQALTCLHCREIFQPRHCHVAVQCAQDEYCAVERTLNLQDEIVYNIGCRPNDHCDHRLTSSNGSINIACLECCETDLCNAQGCGQPGYPAKRGPVCYSCGPTGDLTSCRTVQACQGHEVCFTERNTEFSDTIYTSGCRDKHLCYNRRSSPGRDRKRMKKFILSGNHEKECCTMDLCNAKGRIMHITTSTSTPFTIQTTTDSRKTGMLNTSCLEIMRAYPNSKSGVYKIMFVGSNKSIDVFCDMDTDGGGWIVFQRRVDASVTFDRNFSEYEAGFGNLTGNLWLGLHALFMLTRPNTALRVDMTTASNAKYYAEYSQFYIDPVPLYTVHCQGYSGTAGDTFHSLSNPVDFDGMAFITPDKNRGNICANEFSAGWWYGRCYSANLNGVYRNPGDDNINSIIWFDKLLNEGSLKFVEMKLR